MNEQCLKIDRQRNISHLIVAACIKILAKTVYRKYVSGSSLARKLLECVDCQDAESVKQALDKSALLRTGCTYEAFG